MQGRRLRLQSPLVMAIVNVTPDSFSDTEHLMEASAIAAAAQRALAQGADIIDIGGCSTRPDSEQASEAEELRRVRLGVTAVRAACPDAVISVDTFRSRVAEEALSLGADIINDVSGGLLDPAIFEVAARFRAPYILTHTRAPQAGEKPFLPGMPAATCPDGDLIADMLAFFSSRVEQLRLLGVEDIILDPGYGFGKSLAQNYELLRRQSELLVLGLPILAGVSHKSMIHKPLGVLPSDTLVGTSVINMVALQQGASILRVHEVREAKQVIQLYQLCQA